MLLKTLVVCLFITACFARDAPSSSSTPASDDDQCFVDPCSLPAPEGCVFRYCRTKNSGCTAVYLDAEGREVCTAETPVCESAPCDRYCPYGYQKFDNGCPKCDCVERNNCTSTTCPQVSCSDSERTIVLPGECCPTCVPSCENIQCPEVECRDGEDKVRGPYDCCSVCRPRSTCEDVTCPAVECRDGEQTVLSGCCKVCIPKVDCATVSCPQIKCEEGTTLRLDDDHCCPICRAERACEEDRSVCPALACAEGQVEVSVEDDCCPICRDSNYCETVVCPVFEGDCPDDDDYRVRKEGSCCSYCAGTVCSDSRETRCDGFDRPVCAPGFFRGENCTEVVPEGDRFVITIEITVSGISLTADDIKFFIANKLDIDPMYVTVDVIGDNTFVITVSWDRTNPPKDVSESEIEDQVDQVISSNSNFSTKKSSASALVAGSIFAVVALAL